MSRPVDLVLFDLGGVLVDVPGVQVMLDLTGITSAEELWRRWLECRWVRRFESGACSEQVFAKGMVADWNLSVSPTVFLDGFRDWPAGPLNGAEELVAQVKSVVAVGCLSNTNALHWNHHFATWPLMDLFDHRFASFEMGLLKPDITIFEHVTAVLGISPGRVLFLDDNAVNVDGAAAVGFGAVRAAGVEQARERLVEAGVLPAST